MFEAASFFKNSFSSCASSSYGGGIGCRNAGVAVLNVTECQFNSCTAHENGGGVYCSAQTILIVKDCIFSSCEAEIKGGACAVWDIGESIVLSGCIIKYCNSGVSGGGMYLYNFNLNQSDSIVGESAVIECTTNSKNGGGLCMMFSPAKCNVKELNTQDCVSVSGKGGGCFFMLHETFPANSSKPLFFSCNFHNNTALDDNGNDMYLEDLDQKVTNNPLSECYSTSFEKRFVSNDGYNRNRDDWLPYAVPERRINVITGSDSSVACGSWVVGSVPCRTIKYSVDVTSDIIPAFLYLQNGVFNIETDKINVNHKILSIIGMTREKVNLHVFYTASSPSPVADTDSFFFVGNGTLKLSSMAVTRISATPFSRGLSLIICDAPSPTVSVAMISLSDLRIQADENHISTTDTTEPFSSPLVMMKNGFLQINNVNAEKIASLAPLFLYQSTISAFSQANKASHAHTKTSNFSLLSSDESKPDAHVKITDSTFSQLICTSSQPSVISVQIASSEASFMSGKSISNANSLVSQPFKVELKDLQFLGCTSSSPIAAVGEIANSDVTMNNVTLLLPVNQIVAQTTTGISLTNCDVSLSDCVFSGDSELSSCFASFSSHLQYLPTSAHSSMSSFMSEMITDELCFWSGSILTLDQSSTVASNVSFANSSHGGLLVKGGSLTMTEAQFINNSPQSPNFPSVRHNIICKDAATVEIERISSGDGTSDSPSMWMANEGCTLIGFLSKRASQSFIPTVTNIEFVQDYSNYSITVTIQGTLLLPCNTSFGVIYIDPNTKSVSFLDELPFTSNPNETYATAVFSESLFDSVETDIVHVVVVYWMDDKNKQLTASFPIERVPVYVPEKEKCCCWCWLLLLLLIFVIIMIIICCCCYYHKRKKEKEKQEEEERRKLQQLADEDRERKLMHAEDPRYMDPDDERLENVRADDIISPAVLFIEEADEYFVSQKGNSNPFASKLSPLLLPFVAATGSSSVSPHGQPTPANPSKVNRLSSAFQSTVSPSSGGSLSSPRGSRVPSSPFHSKASSLEKGYALFDLDDSNSNNNNNNNNKGSKLGTKVALSDHSSSDVDSESVDSSESTSTDDTSDDSSDESINSISSETDEKSSKVTDDSSDAHLSVNNLSRNTSDICFVSSYSSTSSTSSLSAPLLE
eukprot:MONOS_5320.1-p1 / transcript=MONOS_5320.1 / gene=MONOS_5320 / organism=Monocercomonoides_exilis_PA203 / gene_product=unspecified product / transcript_product=unspecified product / location=Mono_scaffold00153:61118-64579(-) / protein_length=1154 / sequence_SO=supercontig / SO=protein_coding / is_pseudo=false